jgi:hypothetical protein
MRASIYEFRQRDVLNAFKEASLSGADVKIVFDGRPDSDDAPNKHNREAIKEAGLEAITIPRTQSQSYISHNKFIVLLKKGEPVQVWTGSTNLTHGGIYGHSIRKFSRSGRTTCATSFRRARRRIWRGSRRTGSTRSRSLRRSAPETSSAGCASTPCPS